MKNLKFTRTIKIYLREIDVPLLFSVLAICIIGLVNMYGIGGSDHSLFKKQIIFIVIGFAVMILFSFFNYRYFKNHSLPVLLLYAVSLFLLALTFYSRSIRGTNSWLVWGNLTFEPAELTKLCLIILVAKYFSQRHIHIYQFRHIIISGLYFIVPALLMINQPDLGSAIILSLIWVSLLFAAGINKKHLVVLILIGAIISYGGWTFVLKPYQKARIASFLDQGSDPLGSGYNLIQSKIAIGSGFWFGNGIGEGSQTNLGFLPEPHNDFIFAALAEQLGFIGGITVLGLALLLIYRILLIGSATTANFGKLFSVGLAIFVFAHVFVSAGVNIGLLPVTGLPFPFLSSGGSNLLSIMTGLGILQSIKRYG
ncbi:MAG: FtsW/RodA/SpoVE family cell cycle protein [Candidatus Taylorbacteria bacterium]|nr:FtsW/RodA/SpoVE family cell cycle protein [Candidatus Taylorbacteria bacterium]